MSNFEKIENNQQATQCSFIKIGQQNSTFPDVFIQSKQNDKKAFPVQLNQFNFLVDIKQGAMIFLQSVIIASNCIFIYIFVLLKVNEVKL